MITETRWNCAQCGHSSEAAVCDMCGALPPGNGNRTRETPPIPDHFLAEPIDTDWGDAETESRIWGMPPMPFFFLVGALIAPLFSIGSFMPRFGWFLGALFHESGHTVTALAFGMPAYPAISLRGHAASIHQDQIAFMVFLLWAVLGYVTWHLRHHRAALVLTIAVAVYPVIAFTDLKEGLFLVGGHGGELAMATVCLWRALTGGFTHNLLERGLYSVLGWYLVGSNVWLCGGLATSAAARAHYAASGSFGLTNDYIRLAEDVLNMGLPQVGAVMLIVSLLPIPLSFLIWRLLGR